MSVFENVQVALMARDHRNFTMFRIGARFNRDETSDLLGLVGLSEAAGEQAAELAYGKQKQLELAIALAERPRVLLLDEPSEGLAPRVVESLRDQVQRLKDAGLSIVLAEQNLAFVLSLSDRCHIMEKGEIRHSGSTEELREYPEILERYLTV